MNDPPLFRQLYLDNGVQDSTIQCLSMEVDELRNCGDTPENVEPAPGGGGEGGTGGGAEGPQASTCRLQHGSSSQMPTAAQQGLGQGGANYRKQARVRILRFFPI